MLLNNAKELADEMGISKSKFQALDKLTPLPHIIIGSTRHYEPDKVLEFLRASAGEGYGLKTPDPRIAKAIVDLTNKLLKRASAGELKDSLEAIARLASTLT